MKTITITTQNRKLGAMIPNINLPAIETCRENAPCRKGCYACKGTFLYSNVQQALQKNLSIYKESPESYFNQIQGYLMMCPFKYFRYHSSGDIVDIQYLDLMCKTAKKCKDTTFLCYTKKYELVNEYLTKNKKPKNLLIIFSCWGVFKPKENPFNLPLTFVKFNKPVLDKYIPENAFECCGNCSVCHKCWELKKGESVYFHKH